MIAYHFPPLAGSSGIQRTLRFVRYLPEFGWQPLILTAHPRAYERTSTDQLTDVDPSVPVTRAAAFDTARHLAIGGRYPGFLARPDRWVSWWPAGVAAGLAMIARHKPDLIWSTYPIATAHMIGASLNRLTGIPWVADFRDPMAQEDYPTDPLTWKSFKRIEERAVERATLCTFTTPGAVRYYSNRYPHAADRLINIENGYDEETFEGFEADPTPLNPGRITLLHSGIVYPSERDPTQFLHAVKHLIASGRLRSDQICLRFRASMHDDLLLGIITSLGIQDCVEILPPIPYREALSEMMRADVLLIMQASNCNDQIPAKLYEYLRAGRPILALTDKSGDTAEVLRRSGISAIAPLDSSEHIAEQLLHVLENPTQGTLPLQSEVAACSRRNRTKQFAERLDTIEIGESSR